jgi:hypothetical protein
MPQDVDGRVVLEIADRGKREAIKLAIEIANASARG